MRWLSTDFSFLQGMGKDNEEDVDSKDITDIRISFIAAPEMKKAVVSDMTFQKSS